MKHNMSKRSTTFTLVTLAAVLLSTVAIGSTSASSKVFSNSGNNIITKQTCIADGSCNLSSSNVINREPSSTTPSPSPPEFGTILTLSVSVAKKELIAVLLSGSSVVSQPVPITITFTGTGVPPNLVATIAPGEDALAVVPFEPPTTPGTYTAQAHFAGLEGILLPSDSPVKRFSIT